MKRLGFGSLLTALALAGVVAASVLAGTPTARIDTTTTVPAPKPKPKPRPQPVRLPSGVKIGGVHVGGLSPAAAYAAIRLSYRAPLVIAIGDRTLRAAPGSLGGTGYFWPAVRRAQHAPAGSSVPLFVTVRGSDVRGYVDSLARRFDRTAVDAKETLLNLKPHVVPEVAGRAVLRGEAVAALVEALRENRRGPVTVPVKVQRPEVIAADFGPMIVIRRDSKWLYLYQGERFVRRFQVATGQAVYPTPVGRFEIIQMWRNPWWYPPNSSWAQGLHPVPPGPGNPLGTRWMGISSPGVGIHGTPDPASLGYSASHGCIRMYIPSAEWLFAHVKIGTPVFIVGV